MNKTTLQILTFAAVLFAFNFKIYAQTGRVVYTETVRLDIKLDEEIDPRLKEIKSLIPSERKSEKELIFDEDKSLFKTVDLQEAETERSDNGSVVIMRIESGGNENIIYIKGEEFVERKEFMGREFLIEGRVKKPEWKLTGESKEVLGYNCQKAEYLSEDRKDIAWFTTAIPVSFGPLGYGSLPGLILEMELNNSKTLLEATAVDLDFKPNQIEAPKKGKKVSQEEYEQIVIAKTEEMQQTYGVGGGKVIRIESR
ncbi:MAG: GLPGLI family protein [Bacteroidota bacterium]